MAASTAKLWLTRSIIAVVEQIAPDQFSQWPVYVGTIRPGRAPKPLAGLMPAILISTMARNIARDFAAQARGQGASWLDVADAAGILTPGTDNERAEQAFQWAVGDPGAWDPSVGWRCEACRGWVIDHGPYSRHPDDCETGHISDCPRHLADVAAYHADDD